MATPEPSTWKLPRLRIDRDGAWFHEDEEVTHEGILANLRSNLLADAQGEGVAAEAPALQLGIRQPSQVLVGRRGVVVVGGRLEPLGKAAPKRCERGRLAGFGRSRVKGARFVARLSRAAAYQLLQHVESDEAGRAARLRLGDRCYPLPGEGRDRGSPTEAP